MITKTENLVIDRHCCPVCKSEDRTILFSAKHNSEGFLDFLKFEKFYGKDFYEAYNSGEINELLFEIAECNNCTLVYLTQVLNDKGMELLYNEWLDKDLLKEYYSNQEYSMYEENMLKVIKKHFKGKEKINILDFGAGYGNFCSIASKLGFGTYAFDLSMDKNDHINSLGVTIINNFDKYRGYFDFIYINQVFEHVANPSEILNSLRDCLTDNGLLFMSVPDTKGIQSIIKEEGLSYSLFRFLSPHQHINGFNNSSLKRMGLNTGFKPLSMTDFLGMLNFSMNLNELIFLSKKAIKNSTTGTGLFFSRIN